jgi:hypothetical protein
MNAQKQAEMIATAAPTRKRTVLSAFCLGLGASTALGAKMPIQAGPE